jgi:hypothetical protein
LLKGPKRTRIKARTIRSEGTLMDLPTILIDDLCAR